LSRNSSPVLSCSPPPLESPCACAADTAPATAAAAPAGVRPARRSCSDYEKRRSGEACVETARRAWMRVSACGVIGHVRLVPHCQRRGARRKRVRRQVNAPRLSFEGSGPARVCAARVHVPAQPAPRLWPPPPSAAPSRAPARRGARARRRVSAPL
jgi:hypothetical protein